MAADYTEEDVCQDVESQVVTPTQETVDDPQDQEVITVASDSCQNISLIINEFVADPISGEEEFIEIFNNSSETIDLTNWTMEDGTAKATTLSGTVLGSGFYVVSKPKGVLNNSGDLIVLKCAGQVIDQVTYGDWDDGNLVDNAPAASDPNSVARDSNNQWQVTQQITKGLGNVIVPLVDVKPTEEQDQENDETQKPESNINYQGKVVLNELLPNPVGSDDAEFIELKNISDGAIDLVNFQVGDLSRKYILNATDFTSTLVIAGGLLAVPRSASGIALNNDSETVYLYQPDGTVIDQVEYSESAKEGLGYSRGLGNLWQWSALSTPGAENQLITPNNLPEITLQITKPRQVQIGETIIFDASDSSDPDGDSLSFSWDLGNGQTASEPVIEYSYSEEGEFEVVLTVVDSLGGSAEVKKKITIYSNEEVSAGDPAITKQKCKTTIKVALAEVRQYPNGQQVEVSGLVAVEPGVLGSQVMYLKGSGIQVYLNKKDWPEIKPGDQIRLTGELAESAGERRIKLASGQNIQVLSHDNQIHPEEISVISEEKEGYLVTVTGEVTEQKGSKFWLDTGEEEVLVYLKTSTGISFLRLSAGQKLAVTGIVSQYQDEYRLLPRYQDDIKLINPPAVDITVPATQNSRLIWYLTAGVVVVGMVLVGVYLYNFKLKNKNIK